MRLAFRAILLALLGVGALAAPASATPTHKLGDQLGQVWTDALQTPAAQSPFVDGGPASTCNLSLRGTVAPFGPADVPGCTVKPGTKIFVTGYSFECSTFPGDTPTNGGSSEADLRNCARTKDLQAAPKVTVDGRPLSLIEVETGLLHVTLPADNIFSQPAGTTGQSVAHGWVALLHPLTPGWHTIVIYGPTTVTTTIVVQPRA
jgi:hypothetical protein